jgi:glycosyltransferase involved in cell wall biosynthesis
METLYRKIFTIYLNRLRKKLAKQPRPEKPRLFFGTVPIINNKYWSNALKQAGYQSSTVMQQYYDSINKKEDYDLYVDEIIEKEYGHLPMFFRRKFRAHLFFDHVLKNYDILHISFDGIFSFPPDTYFDEGFWLKIFNKKVIIIPYGGDFLQYSRITNYSYLYGLLYHYPDSGKNEAAVKFKVDYWTRNSDMLILSNIPEGKSNWQILPFVNLSIDTASWKPKENYSDADGVNDVVYVAHSPNHRAIKGTEFLFNAVEELRNEGLKIELLLLEKMQNDEVRRILSEKTDILAEQLLLGYALSGVEGMAVGLPVISNLENEQYTRLYRRYSYLNECPVLSSTPERIKTDLRILIKNPALRRTLGQAGRKYAEKYHSPQSGVFMFQNIYDKIWHNKDVNLMGLYHPLLKESYNNRSLKIDHPLVENKIPLELLNTLKK